MGHLVCRCKLDDDAHSTQMPAAKQRKVVNARPQQLPIPPAMTATNKGPAPYPQHLMPIPSHLCLHCLAKDKLWLWVPTNPTSRSADRSRISDAEHERVKDTMLHAWEEEMWVSYGAGLLMWHCFCNEKGVPKQGRAPATQALLSVFIVHLAMAYLGKTISGYMNGVWAWHILHGLPWALKKKEMDTMLRVAKKLTPNTSRRKKHCPYTSGFISAI